MPATSIPLCKLPVCRVTNPATYGRMNPPRFATDVINAMPVADAYPVRNALADAKKGPKKSYVPAATMESRAIENAGDVDVRSTMNALPAAASATARW